MLNHTHSSLSIIDYTYKPAFYSSSSLQHRAGYRRGECASITSIEVKLELVAGEKAS